jgi:curli biogenesis system outer membrane secretion channel CsgG
MRNIKLNTHPLFLLFVVVSFFSGSCGSSDQPNKPKSLSSQGHYLKIAVIGHSDFLPDQTGISKGSSIGLPDVLTDRILEHLANSKRFVPVERKALRKVVLEQRFGKNLQKTYLDRTLDKAIASMKEVGGGMVAGAPIVAPQPTGGGITAGAGDVGTTGALANYNDILKDFQDLGSAVGADYLVLGNVEKIERSAQETAVPYSEEGRKVRKNVNDARISLRIIEVKTGTIAGATSLRTMVTETLFTGGQAGSDEYSFYDHLGRLAAVAVLDVTFPARIASLEPLVISRGTNDGTMPGDIYVILREGKEIKDDSGIVIGKLKTEIGRVEVVTPQETVSIVKPVAGGNMQKDDLAVLDMQAVEGKSAGMTATAAVPLAGSQAAAKQRPRVAVGLIKSGSTARTGKDAAEHTPIFTDTIISKLTQTKRFQLIDRQEVDQLLNEQTAQALAQGQDLASAMGTLKGADYLVYGSLASFSVEDSTIKLPNSNRSFAQKNGYVEGNMRIVDARSGHVMESRKVSVTEPVEASADGSRIVTALADAYAEEVVLLLMNAIYPIKVASAAADGTVYINRGNDGGLSTGETLEAFKPGKPVIDPDTKVQLGVEETLIGKVTLNEVEDARSKGTFTGSGMVQAGDILKRTPANREKRTTASPEPSLARTGAALPGSGKPAETGKGGKATLAVGLIRLNPSARTDGFDQGHLKRITDDFIVKLSNTNRFQVMERQEVDQVLDEKAFAAIASGGNIKDRLKQLAGADYLIHGEISNLYTDTQRKNIAVLNEEQVRVSGNAEGTLRIVDTQSGAVVAADKITIHERIKQAGDKTQELSSLMDRFTTEAVSLILGRLYPIKLLGAAEDGVVYLNRGDDAGLKNGAVFDVMRPGKELIDQDTGLSFGKAETKVASLEIVAVEPSRARAKVTSGGEVKAGDILRKPQSPVKKPEEQNKVMQPAW